MRGHFADWAAHNSAQLDYLTREQVEFAYLIVGLSGDWDLFRPAVWAAQDAGTAGGWLAPPGELAVRGWAYNVWNITNTMEALYTFQLEAEPLGSQGGQAFFEGRVVVVGADGVARVLALEMESDGLAGAVTVAAGPKDCSVLLVVAAVPEMFGSYQHYDYTVRIEREGPGPTSQGSSMEQITSYLYIWTISLVLYQMFHGNHYSM